MLRLSLVPILLVAGFASYPFAPSRADVPRFAGPCDTPTRYRRRKLGAGYLAGSARVANDTHTPYHLVCRDGHADRAVGVDWTESHVSETPSLVVIAQGRCGRLGNPSRGRTKR